MYIHYIVAIVYSIVNRKFIQYNNQYYYYCRSSKKQQYQQHR